MKNPRFCFLKDNLFDFILCNKSENELTTLYLLFMNKSFTKR